MEAGNSGVNQHPEMTKFAIHLAHIIIIIFHNAKPARHLSKCIRAKVYT